GLGGAYPGELLNAADDGVRRALEMGEHVGEAKAIVIGLPRPFERAVGAAESDETRDPAGEHQRDGGDLSFEPRHFAKQRSIEGGDEHRALTTPTRSGAPGRRRLSRSGSGRLPASPPDGRTRRWAHC